MEIITQAIVDAVSGDYHKARLIKQKTNQKDMVDIRYKVFYELNQKGFSTDDISAAFNCSDSKTYRNIQIGSGQIGLKRNRELTSDVIDRITHRDNAMSDGALYSALMDEGFLRNTIADYFDVTLNTIKSDTYQYRKYLDVLKFQELRKKIVKF